jgi:DNA polymerase III subunit delta
MARQRTQGVVVVVGMDSYLAEEATERLLTETVGANRQDAVELLHGDESTWAQVVDAARSPSLFAPVKAVVVRNAEALKGPDDEMRRWLEATPTNGLLILVAAKPDKRRAIWKRLVAEATVLPADPLKGRALRGYVAEQVRLRGLKLAAESVDELVERVGQSLRRLVGELDKLTAFARGRGALTEDEVEQVLGRGIARPVFRLGDAFMARESVKTLELMEELLGERESGVYLLGVLYRALRTVRAVQALRGSGLGPAEIATRVGAPPFKGPELREWGGRWSSAQVERALAAIAGADRALKSGADARSALTAAVLAACGSRTKPRPGAVA